MAAKAYSMSAKLQKRTGRQAFANIILLNLSRFLPTGYKQNYSKVFLPRIFFKKILKVKSL